MPFCDFYFFYFMYFCFICAKVRAEYELPPYLHPCFKSDPKFNECMVTNAEALLPEILNGNKNLNIPNLNPLKIAQISINQGNKQIGLNMAVQDVEIYGIGTMKINELDLNMDAKIMKSRACIQYLEILGKHKTVGNIMVVKVYGEGKFNITTENVDYSYETAFDYEKRSDGYEYAVTKSQKLMITSVGKVTFNLENMLGDEKLDTAVNDLLNQYWKELSNDLMHEMTDDLLQISTAIINTILGAFPVQAVVKD